MLVVTIEGNRGEGKTELAMAIAVFLRHCGCKVVYEGHQKSDTAAVQKEIEALDLMTMPFIGDNRIITIQDRS
jgi:hypothetical protein